MARKIQVDTPRANSWAEQQKNQSVFLHHIPLHPTFSEEQKLINISRRFPLVRVMGEQYADECNKKGN